MKVLVLGGTGYIGGRLVSLMQAQGRMVPVCASRHACGDGLRLDTRDESALAHALRRVDAVVNCVAGSAGAIAGGARSLARAARATQVRSVVHLSSMAVYGDRQGPVTEASAWGRPQGWYARAKQEAEKHMADLAQDIPRPGPGVAVTVLRPGCVWGPDSALWVGRIARWLAQGRLGDLGDAGDGWTHGVMVGDVCMAILRALEGAGVDGALRTFNLAAPDSPRWNEWFTDLALALGATPVRRIHPLQLRADAFLLGPPLHAARRLLARTQAATALPEAISPGLLRLWQSSLRMDASAATGALGLAWTPYSLALGQCVASLRKGHGTATGAGCESPASVRAR